MMLIYVTVGVGLAVSDETGLDWLVTRAHRAVRQIGVFGGVHVGRWQDDSGATLILGRRSGELLDLIPPTQRPAADCFDAAPAGVLRGESTPFYLYNRDAQRRIRARIPDAKLIVVLRDPVERAHSNWTHLWSAGLEPIGDVVQACAEEDRRIAAGWAEFWHYTSLGRYGEQLEHLFGLFPREQVLLLRYRTLIDDPARALDRICAFLCVPQGVLSRMSRENVTAHPDRTLRHRAVATTLRAVSTVSAALPEHPGSGLIDHLERILQQDAAPRKPLTWDQREALIPSFETDIKLLGSVTGEDFSDWLGPRGDSGGLVGARPSGQRQARNGQPPS